VRRGFALAAVVVIWPHLLSAADVAATTGPPQVLQKTWNDNMLSGHFGYFYNGTETSPFGGSCRQPTGWVWIHEVAGTGCGLSVIDLRERRWLKSRGGWALEGGLLGWRDVGEGTVELYGRRALRHEPFLEPWPHFWIGNKAWSASHEFFLVGRDRQKRDGVILRRWNVPDPEASGGHSFVTRGRLECEGACQLVRVHVMHAHERDLISELVDVENSEWR
jgi:hypothetical protein